MDLAEIRVETSPQYQDTESPELPKKKTLKLLCYNIFMRPPGIKNNYSDYKDLRLLDFCPVMTNYDIVLLQEMFSTLTTRKCRLKIAAAKCGFSHFAESPSPKLLSGHIVHALSPNLALATSGYR